MNTKLLIAGAVVVVILGALIVMQPKGIPTVTPHSPISTTTVSTTSASSTTTHQEPSLIVKPSTQTGTYYATDFDTHPLVSTSTHPKITGIANVAQVDVIIYNSAGHAVVGSSGITVVNGHWDYTSPIALQPGLYTVVLFGGEKNIGNLLTVKSPS